MPRILTDTDVADFRERLCAVAERLFVEQGLEAVTMRQLSAELGVSPMTPYRYFDDKDEILATVRANALNRFADYLGQAHAEARRTKRQGNPLGDAYISFALENPSTYKLMFDLNQPDISRYPQLGKAIGRARAAVDAWVREMAAEGELAGDPAVIGTMYWVAAHGAVVLELAGKLAPGAALELHRVMSKTLARGLRP